MEARKGYTGVFCIFVHACVCVCVCGLGSNLSCCPRNVVSGCASAWLGV